MEGNSVCGQLSVCYVRDLDESDNVGDGSGVADDASDRSNAADTIIAGPLAGGEVAADTVVLHDDVVLGGDDCSPGHGDASLAARRVFHLEQLSRTSLNRS